MRILHICREDTGGAGLCCLRIHTALLKKGIESKVIVMKKTSNAPEVYRYGNRVYDFLDRLTTKSLELIGLRLTERSKVRAMAGNKIVAYSLPTSYIDLTKCDWVEWADIIHLHWVNWYLDYPSFFRKIGKPIVWTLHDENLFYGAAHYSRDVMKDNKEEKKLQALKLEILEPLTNINIVFLSRFMYEKYSSHPIVGNKKQVVINNSVDDKKFYLFEKKEMRKAFGIPENSIVFGFVAYNILDPRKGLEVLISALESLSISDNVKILAIGNYDVHQSLPPIVKTVGLVSDSMELSKLLCCCDYFALPSYEEAFAQSPIEAMVCGIPVIAFPVSGMDELINVDNGIICEGFTKEALQKGIELIRRRNYNSRVIRNDVISRFSPGAIAADYINLYNEII